MNDILYIGAMDCSRLIKSVEVRNFAGVEIKRFGDRKHHVSIAIDLDYSDDLRLLIYEITGPENFVFFQRNDIVKLWKLAIVSELENGRGFWITG